MEIARSTNVIANIHPWCSLSMRPDLSAWLDNWPLLWIMSNVTHLAVPPCWISSVPKLEYVNHHISPLCCLSRQPFSLSPSPSMHRAAFGSKYWCKQGVTNNTWTLRCYDRCEIMSESISLRDRAEDHLNLPSCEMMSGVPLCLPIGRCLQSIVKWFYGVWGWASSKSNHALHCCCFSPV